ncbi:MAG: glycosyltransferase family 2 protein, partial [bacterium]|nr:glycosyltransferase family 2 protein [bacterium]
MSPKTPKTLIRSPAFKEEATIGGVIDSVMEGFPDGDIIVIDDGSQDATGKVAALRGVKVVRLCFNLGIGGAVQTGYKYARDNGYDIAVQVDGDGQHPADQIGDIVAPVASGTVDVVVGSRFLGVGDYKPSIPR